MKKLVMTIVALFSISALAGITANQEYQLNTFMGPTGQATQLGTLIQKTHNLVVGKYSFAVQGGATTATIKLLTDLKNSKSYVTIPSGSIITNVWVNTLTALTSGDGGGVATVDLNSITGNDVLSGKSHLAFSPIFAATPVTGTTSTYIKVSSLTTLTMDINLSSMTAGKFNAYISYVLGD